MTRILLPLAIVAAIFFGPMFSHTSHSDVMGEVETQMTGSIFLKEAFGCLQELKAPIGDDCRATAEVGGSSFVSQAISWTAMLAIAAGVLGVIGILPMVGRLTSLVTIAAGLAALGSMGLLALTIMGTDAGLPGLQWGAYLAAALGLLTLISGLSGLRGR